jgi:hypothetical protein
VLKRQLVDPTQLRPDGGGLKAHNLQAQRLVEGAGALLALVGRLVGSRRRAQGISQRRGRDPTHLVAVAAHVGQGRRRHPLLPAPDHHALAPALRHHPREHVRQEAWPPYSKQALTHPMPMPSVT